VELSPEALAVAHSARVAKAATRPTLSARPRTDSGRKRSDSDSDSIAVERKIFEAAQARGEKLTGKSLAEAAGGRYGEVRGRQILARLRSEVKQDATV
jgi:hypothetical protein